MKNLEVPLQVASTNWFINIKKEGFEVEFNLNQVTLQVTV
jgi:hypothetical protein